ncbi:MAG: nucleotide exchange factor GrpE [Pseudomonadales bacterium]|nr:nucleotide exchange factor GrpE [Pseudomonadales bacterium]
MAQEEQTLNTENGAEQPAPETQADPAAAPDAEAEAEIVALREQLVAAEDRALRVQAEAQNMIRRAERDVENARKFALERFVGALLPVIDNLERAQAAMGEPTDEIRPLLEGVQLTHRSFLDVMQKFEVAVVDPAGEVFNPELHQAMSMIESPDAAPNSVVAVMQKGYTLNGRLVRPAMVVVAKATSTPHIDTTA